MKNVIYHTPVNMIGERYLRRHFTVYKVHGCTTMWVVMTNSKGKLLAYRPVNNVQLYFLIEQLFDHCCIFDGYKEYKI